MLKVNTTSVIIKKKVGGKGKKKVGEKLEHGEKGRKMTEINISRTSGPEDQDPWKVIWKVK